MTSSDQDLNRKPVQMAQDRASDEQAAEQILWDQVSRQEVDSDAAEQAAQEFPELAASVRSLDDALRNLGTVEPPASLHVDLSQELERTRVLDLNVGRDVGSRWFRWVPSARSQPVALAAVTLIFAAGLAVFFLQSESVAPEIAAGSMADPSSGDRSDLDQGNRGDRGARRADVASAPALEEARKSRILVSSNGTELHYWSDEKDRRTADLPSNLRFEVRPSKRGAIAVRLEGSVLGDQAQVSVAPPGVAEVFRDDQGIELRSSTDEPYEFVLSGLPTLTDEENPDKATTEGANMITVSIGSRSVQLSPRAFASGSAIWSVQQQF